MKTDIITFKKIYRLLEDSNLSFLFSATDQINVLKVLVSLKKNNFVQDFCEILTNEKSMEIKDFIILIRKFFDEVKTQKEKAQPLYERLSQIKFKNAIKTDVSTDNIYLDLQYQLSKHDINHINELTLDEGAYILLQEALIDKAKEKQMERDAKSK